MGQITRTTNPTGLRQIDRRHFVVRIGDDRSGGRVFWLDRFDREAARIEPHTRMSCVAHAGSTEEYFDLGPACDFDKRPLSLRGLATDKPLKFRFIFHNPGDSLLVGYTDGVRALDEAGYLGSSLVDIEPTDLHGIVWKLSLPQGVGSGEKPNVLVEKSLFPTAISAASHTWFGVLVMPEVMRQIATEVARDPSALEDSESWIAPWAEFISALGIELPKDFDDDDTAAMQDWAEEVVTKFASKGVFKQHMTRALKSLDDVQP